MRFVDTKRFSPVIYGNDLPHEKDMYFVPSRQIPEAEKQYEDFFKKGGYIIDEDWWMVQDYRCRNGYTVADAIEFGGENFVDGVEVFDLGDNTIFIPHLDMYIKDRKVTISGRMYFYLNFWKIKRVDEESGRKKVMNPRFTDLSWENWVIREMMYLQKKDNMWAKSRQRGLSEEEACNLAYDFLFFPESQGVVVAGEEKYSQNTFKFIKRGLAGLRNTQFYKQLERNTDEWLLARHTGSEIYCRTAKDNPEVLSSLSPSKVLFEEVGIWKKGLVKECAEFVKASLEAEGIKTGYIQYTGTGGNVENSVEDMEEIAYEPEKFNVLSFKNRYSKDSTIDKQICCFIPAWKFEIIDKDGNSLREKSIEKLEKDRANAKPDERYRKITQKPIYLEEIFNIASGGYFGQERTQYLNDQYFKISTHREMQVERTGRLEWNDSKRPFDGVKFIDDPLGELIIIEEPYKTSDNKTPLNLYLAGTDSYDQDESHYSDSKGSIIVKKRFIDLAHTYNMPVAHLIQRPETSKGGAEIFYENCAKLCVYYGCAVNNIEWSNPRIFDWFINHGFESLLMLRPMIATANVVKQSFVSNRYGTDKSLKPHALANLRDRLTEEYISHVFIKRVLLSLAKFKYDPTGKKYNCDTTMSMAMMELADKEYEFVTVKEKPEEKRHVRSYRNINGQLKEVWV